jgi:hypothetical protein
MAIGRPVFLDQTSPLLLLFAFISSTQGMLHKLELHFAPGRITRSPTLKST